MVGRDYTREELIALCEEASVLQERWYDRDSASAQQQVGELWALLRAGCDFRVRRSGDYCVTNDKTVWVDVTFEGFNWFELREKSTDTFYVPTPERLAERAGRDWYC